MTKFTNSALLAGMIQDIQVLLGVESVFMFAYTTILIIVSTVTILISSLIYTGKNFSVKDLLSKVAKIFARRLITWFHIKRLQAGYAILALLLLLNLLVIVGRPDATKAISVAFSIPAFLFHIYLSVVWQLAVIVTVIEGSCGNEALGKAGLLVKGNRLHGFVLSLFFDLPSVLVFQGFRIITTAESPTTKLTIELIMINLMFLLNMFSVLYCFLL